MSPEFLWPIQALKFFKIPVVSMTQFNHSIRIQTEWDMSKKITPWNLSFPQISRLNYGTSYEMDHDSFILLLKKWSGPDPNAYENPYF